MGIDTTSQKTQDQTLSGADERQKQERPKKSISNTKLGEYTKPDNNFLLTILELSIRPCLHYTA